MSLICKKCGKIIVMSNNPDHYGVCASCPLDKEAVVGEEK